MAELRLFILLCTIGFHVSHGYRGGLHWATVEDISPDIIPLTDETPLNVSLSFQLMNIVEADRDTNQVEVILWIQTSWQVPIYRSLFDLTDNIRDVSLPSSRVWTPDIAIYNAIAAPELLTPDRVMIFRDGTLMYVPSKRVRFTCDLKNITSFRGATCRIKVGSWTYNNRQLALISPSSSGVNITEYFESPRYLLLGATQSLNQKSYSCCDDVFEDMEISFRFKEKI